MVAQCSNCFFVRGSTGSFTCNRNSPTSLSNDLSTEQASWLPVDDTQWCGNYSATDPGVYTPGVPQPPGGQCSNCFFARGTSGNLTCQRIAPESYSVEATDSSTRSEWIKVHDADWCGAYAAVDPAVFRGTGLTLLTANTTFYVDPVAGNDTNNGLTSGTAWQHLQYAINYLTKNYYQFFCATAIIVADGTLAESVTLNAMPGYNFSLAITGDIAAQANCIIKPSSGAPITASGFNGSLSIYGFTLDGTVSGSTCLSASGSTVTLGYLNFNLANGQGGISAQNYANVSLGAGIDSCNVNGSLPSYFAQYSGFSQLTIGPVALTFTGSPVFSGDFLLGSSWSNCTMLATFDASAATVTGPQLNLKQYANFTDASGNNTSSYIPGSGIFIDSTCSYTTGAGPAFGIQQSAGAPSSTNLPIPGTTVVISDTVNDTIGLYANIGGSIKKVFLT